MCTTEIFCKVDDFCNDFIPQFDSFLIGSGAKKRMRNKTMCLSERMLIMIIFHQSDYRTFKKFYLEKICKYHKADFPNLLSYNRFVELMPEMLVPMTVFLYSQRGRCTGISYIDSTSLAVCLKARAKRNKVFKDIAGWGKSSVDWFYGLKLHIIVNENGELIAFCITSGNTDDRVPVRNMSKEIFGKLFGDKGYISEKLATEMMNKNIQLFTTLRKNMKNRVMNVSDKILLRKRVIVETVNDQLKNISQIQHTRHRSPFNCMLNILAGLAAYCFQDKKPSLNINRREMLPILV